MNKKTLLEKLQDENPDTNIVFVAIDKLTAPEDIRQFYSEYIVYLRETGDKKIRRDAVRVANSNIGYVVVYYGKETTDRWMKCLPEISHPVFGKKIPFKEHLKTYKKGVKTE